MLFIGYETRHEPFVTPSRSGKFSTRITVVVMYMCICMTCDKCIFVISKFLRYMVACDMVYMHACFVFLNHISIDSVDYTYARDKRY